MKSVVLFVHVAVGSMLASCMGPAAQFPVAERRPVCHSHGTITTDEIAFGTSARPRAISVYLPPCYQQDTERRYPVLYWTAVGWPSMFDQAEALIQKHDVPPFIFVMLDVDMSEGLGADEKIVGTVVPYIDSHYRTEAGRLYRSIAGISHGAAIAVRAAFQAPAVFSRVAVISGGIDNSEQEKLSSWILSTPRDQQLEIMIDVGDEDGIITLTHSLTEVLDKTGLPYIFTHAQGGHDPDYWNAHMNDYLKWLMAIR